MKDTGITLVLFDMKKIEMKRNFPIKSGKHDALLMVNLQAIIVDCA